ncbi:ABC transporter substrate-binding protein [Pseudoflavonifractor phocaeensis]|uniref:ABC transporter substrate-binding protein n=1 Tax=Pseudoflavonifractor phocaeensis TaxID=1870988 RepID=UPI00210E6174|nr:extracellular solute-binding protein [Pseudoflavonifractor phocaeensis]MCQ4862929.1 extracellular solute-binding protein [Pseudoflavonifractor phocaeensis]
MKKKLLAMLLAFSMVLALCACGDAGGMPSGSPAASPASSPAAAPSGEPVPSEPTPSDSAGLSGTLEVWSSGEELGRFMEGFNQVHPDVTVNITVVPNADFIAKLTPTLASGQGAPDIFTGESDYVKYLVDSGFWDDLRQAPYSADTSDVWDYVASVGTDASGALRALSWQASPGSIMYRRDMAKEVLGTDDPAEVAALLSSNDAMLDVAAKLKDKGIKMFASWQDIMNMQFSNRAQPWVVDDRLVIDESMLDFMDMAKTIAENGYDLNVDPWAPEWSAAVESTDTFCYVLPSWGYQFVVKPAADTTKGQWAMCQGSVPYVKGGTWLGIYKDSPNKDLAWAFLEYCCLNSEAQQAYAAEYGEYVSLKSADQALAAGAGEEVLGGQNPFAFYNEQMEKIPSDLMTAYDGTINTAFLSAAKAYATGVLSKDDALQQFKDDVANAYPELTID